MHLFIHLSISVYIYLSILYLIIYLSILQITSQYICLQIFDARQIQC